MLVAFDQMSSLASNQEGDVLGLHGGIDDARERSAGFIAPVPVATAKLFCNSA